MLEAPEKTYAAKSPGVKGGGVKAAAMPRRSTKGPLLRRDLTDDYAEQEAVARVRRSRFGGIRFRLRGGVPRSLTGRVMAGAVALGALLAATAGLWEAHGLLLRDKRMVIASSSAIQIAGNNHLTRPQLLSIFGEDVDRNILTIPLAERRAQLEQLPWVEHATVMRLLPNKVRVAIVERTPVAFVRQGGQIGLVDGHGVLLDMSADSLATNHYSFPVVTGITNDEPLSTRAARMELFARFLSDLDAGKGKISDKLSEVDLSSPEDVKALVPSGTADILVHFGDDDFLARYRRFEERLPEWQKSYPHLASADMRYERQVVLEMAAGAAVPATADEQATAAAAKVPAVPGSKAAKLEAHEKKTGKTADRSRASAKPAVKPASRHLQTAVGMHGRGKVGGGR